MSSTARRILAVLNNPRHRGKLMQSLNRCTIDEGAAPVGKGEMTILKDMESLDQEHDQYMEDLRSKGLGE